MSRVVAAAAALAVGSAPALAQTAAERDVPPGLERTQRSAHFLAHFTTTGPNATQAAAVRVMLQAAELGLSRLTRRHAFQMPKPDSDGLVDIYIHDRLGAGNVAQAGADDDRAGVPSSAYLEVDAQERDRGTLVHELAHVIQYGYGMGTENDWLLEGTAAWASTAVYGAATTDGDYVTPISAGLRCDDDDCPGDGPYGVWRFWQSVTERFGPRFIGQLFRREGALVRRSGGDPSLQAVRAALAARGSTLPRELQAYVETSARANWQHPKLRPIQSIVVRQAEEGEEVTRVIGGNQRTRLNTTLLPLAGKYLRITEDDPGCQAGTLRVRLRLPSRTGTRPSVLISVGRRERLARMTRSGGAWVSSFRWPRCNSDAYVLVSNGDAARPAAVQLDAAWTKG